MLRRVWLLKFCYPFLTYAKVNGLSFSSIRLPKIVGKIILFLTSCLFPNRIHEPIDTFFFFNYIFFNFMAYSSMIFIKMRIWVCIKWDIDLFSFSRQTKFELSELLFFMLFSRKAYCSLRKYKKKSESLNLMFYSCDLCHFSSKPNGIYFLFNFVIFKFMNDPLVILFCHCSIGMGILAYHVGDLGSSSITTSFSWPFFLPYQNT